ncbi:MAG TPA: ATP-binding protein [Acidimicrobiales bacterium]|nr:ATP-binding protein [Acidimicrobiales bacterium]
MTGGRRASINLDPGPASVGVARRGLVATLDRWAVADDLIQRAVLVTSELVTNAVLHAGGAVCLRVETHPRGGLRLEVVDRGDGSPMPRRYGPEASTGRGLALVESLCAAWGVDERADGKVVWAVVSSDEAPLPRAAEVHDGPRAAGSARVVPLVLPDVPVRTYLEMQSHHDALLRELDLVAFRMEEPGSEESDTPLRVREMVLRSRRRFSHQRETFARQIAAARAQGAPTVELRDTLPVAAALELGRYVNLLEEAEQLARQGLLLAVEPSAPIVALRRWLVAESSAQLEEGRAPVPFGR